MNMPADTDHDLLWLLPEEVYALTARRRWSAQCRVLAQMQVPFQPNAVGRPLVERAIVTTSPRRPGRKPREPNWSALNGPSTQNG